MTKKINQLLDKFNTPYHLNKNPYYNLFISISMGGIVYFFLSIIQPLTIKKITTNIDLYAKITSIVIISTFLTYNFIIKRLFKSWFIKWNIKKHIITFIGLILIASSINFNTNRYINKNGKIIIENYFDFFSVIIGIGLIPMSFYFIIDERFGRFEKRSQIKSRRNEKKYTVLLNSEDLKDKITVNVNELIYIHSESNYASIFEKKKKNIEEKIVRINIKNIEEKLRDYKKFKRCHPNYIINTDYIAQELTEFINLKYINKNIPISRNYKKTNKI